MRGIGAMVEDASSVLLECSAVDERCFGDVDGGTLLSFSDAGNVTLEGSSEIAFVNVDIDLSSSNSSIGRGSFTALCTERQSCGALIVDALEYHSRYSDIFLLYFPVHKKTKTLTL